MSKITTNTDLIERKCDDVYYTEGMKIAYKLLMVCLMPKYQQAVGLAHNQIGGTKSVFIAKLETITGTNKWQTFINPTITDKSKNTYISDEGCMSFPNKPNKVKTHNWIELRHQVKARNDVKGSSFITERFEGFDAIIIQHECDHLNGIHIHNKEKEEVNDK